MGLDAALEELTKTFRWDYGLKCVFHTDGEPKSMDKDISVLLYGLVLELLRNVVKHAKANRVVVESSRIGDELRITVSDDGTGLDPEIVSGKKRSKGFGLFAIREAIKELGGSLDAESTAAGTTIILTAPMEQQQALAD